MDIVKQYPNGQILTISDDGVSPKEVLKATLAKVFTADDGEKHLEVVLEATDNDITSEINALATQIDSLQAKLMVMTTRRTALRTELLKLPERGVTEVIAE